MIYDYRKTCTCGNVDLVKVDKKDAAFGLKEKDVWNLKCTKCGNTKFDSIIFDQPEIDRELLTLWANNIDYNFSEQDEDVLLAQYKGNNELYTEFIDNPSIIENKKEILKESLRIINNDKSTTREPNSKHTDFLESLIHESIENPKVKANFWDKVKEFLK